MIQSAQQQELIIGIVTEQLSPRLVYTISMIFKRFLGLKFELISKQELDESKWKGLAIAYTKTAIEGLPCIYASGLLFESHIRMGNEKIDFICPNEKFILENDIFSHFFFHLSQYAHYQKGNGYEFDEQQRHPDLQVGYYLHEDLRRLEKVLKGIIPNFETKRSFDFEITIDVDHPWKHLNKPSHVKWGGLLKSIFRPSDFVERWRALFQNKDPYAVLPIVKQLCPAPKTKVFFLVGGTHTKDSRFDLEIPAYRDLILDWKNAGFEIGLHPSYETFKDAALLKQQKKSLESVIEEVSISRQHYLRYSLPETFRNLNEAGIKREYSICPKHRIGLATGISLPYLWFDLERNEPTSIEIVPAVAMDRTLLSNMKLKPEAAIEELKNAIEKLKGYQGKFVLILHNETFSESGEWKGWLKVIEKTMSLLQK